MKYKINFRNLVASHIAICVLLAVALLIVESDKRILKWILAGVGLSLFLQILVYWWRPTWFEDKKNPQP